jgi:hypothetical protein
MMVTETLIVTKMIMTIYLFLHPTPLSPPLQLLR